MSDLVESPDGKLTSQCEEGLIKSSDHNEMRNLDKLGELCSSIKFGLFSDTNFYKSALSSAKTGKEKKKVSFSERDLFYATEYQTPFVNENDENVDETVHVDIASMISGDDSASSHVSFNTLDKATAGSAFDTESFDDLPLRLSHVESEGPDRFSMDLVIQKLMNFQVSLQPALDGRSSRDYPNKEGIFFEPGTPLLPNIPDNDDDLEDRRQASEANEFTLDLIRAASKSLIDHFKPNRQQREASASNSRRASLVEHSFIDNSRRASVAEQQAFTGINCSDDSFSTINSSNRTLVVAQNDSAPGTTSAQIAEKQTTLIQIVREDKPLNISNESDTKPKSIVETDTISSVIIECKTTTVVKLDKSPLEVVDSIPKARPPTSSLDDSISEPEPPADSPGSSQTAIIPKDNSPASARKALVLKGPVGSRLSVDLPFSPFMLNDSVESTVDSWLNSPRGFSGIGESTEGKSDSKSTEDTVMLNLLEAKRSHQKVESKPDDAHNRASRKSLKSLGPKLAFGSGGIHDPSAASKIDYSSYAVNEAAALWAPDTDTPNRRPKGVPRTEASFKESSSATTNPCDSRRPSLNNNAQQVEATPAETEANVVRVKPCRLAVFTPNIPAVEPVSAAQFRRHERLNRHESVAIDMSKGVERYRKGRTFWNIICLWLLLPVAFCFLAYGVIPYDYIRADTPSSASSSGFNGTSPAMDPALHMRKLGSAQSLALTPINYWAASLFPWTLLMIPAAALTVEIYSSVISEIEFGVVIWEDSPGDYWKTGIVVILMTLAMQIIIFCAWGAGHERSWLALVAIGSTGMGLMLYKMFYKSRSVSSISLESIDVFRRFLNGLFILFCVTGVGYTIFAITYAQFADLKRGLVGFFLASVFPLFRVLLIAFIERCPALKWGQSRGGLCAGPVVTIVVTMWHGVFLSLIAACVSSAYELVALSVVEFSVQLSVMYIIAKLPSSSLLKSSCESRAGKPMVVVRNSSSSRYKKEPETVPGGCKARRVIAAVHGSNDIETPRTLMAKRNLITNVVDVKELNSQASSNNSSERLQCMMGDTRSHGSPVSTIPAYGPVPVSGKPVDVDEAPGVIRPTSIKGSGRARTPGDEVYEARLATWLGVTWITGTLTPLAFLICSALFSVGPNRRLFSAKVDMWRSMGGPTFGEISDVEVVANLTRVWSLSLFNRDASNLQSDYWSAPISIQGESAGVNRLASKMLCVSFSHMLFLVGGYLWFRYYGDGGKGRLFSKSLSGLSREGFDDHLNSCRASKDLFGLISALLSYHYNIIALSAVMTMAVIFSVVFPWHGMNSSF